MTVKKLITFSFLIFVLFACKKEGEQIVPTYNERGEFFSALMQAQNVKKVRTYRSIPNAPGEITLYGSYSFPGNNFIRLVEHDWRGDPQGEKNYNLERVIWYEIDEEWDNNERIKVMDIEFDEQ